MPFLSSSCVPVTFFVEISSGEEDCFEDISDNDPEYMPEVKTMKMIPRMQILVIP